MTDLPDVLELDAHQAADVWPMQREPIGVRAMAAVAVWAADKGRPVPAVVSERGISARTFAKARKLMADAPEVASLVAEDEISLEEGIRWAYGDHRRQDHILYRYYDNSGVLIYVGISADQRRRDKQHRREREWYDLVETIKLERFATRDQLVAAESVAIKSERPRFNVAGTDQGEPLPLMSDAEMLRRA